jgi:hypothetical protein
MTFIRLRCKVYPCRRGNTGSVERDETHALPEGKKKGQPEWAPLIFMVPGAGIEPAQPQGPRDFKSLASTSSATQAIFMMRKIYILSAKQCQGIRFPANFVIEKPSPYNFTCFMSPFYRDLLMEFIPFLCNSFLQFLEW